jgi:hypothetical protein
MRRLAPAISLSTGNGRVDAKAKLSQFVKVFRRAADDLRQELNQLNRSSTGAAPA